MPFKMTSDKIKRVSETWEECFEEIKKGEFFAALAGGGFLLSFYKGFLRETFHNASLNPRLGSLFHAHFRSRLPALESRLVKNNARSVGHSELAIADLRLLGEDTAAIRNERALPATEAMAGFIAFQIQHRNPLAYLGYLYHLDAAAAVLGPLALKALAPSGVPGGAMSFLKEHADGTPQHLEWTLQYVDGFADTEENLDAVLYGLRGTCELHGASLRSLSDRARRESDWDMSPAPARERAA
jgi:hypothetical protein